MGRFLRLLRWELDNPLVVLIFLTGLILGFGMVHQADLSVAASVGSIYTTLSLHYQVSSPSGIAGPQSWASRVDYASTPTGMAVVSSLRVGFGMYTFLMILIGGLIFRWDRDSGYAPVVYSLPYSKSKIFTAKLVAFLSLSLMLYILPYLSAVLTSNADILSVVLSILSSGRAIRVLILSLYAVLYTVSITAFISCVLPGLFPTIIGTFFLVAVSSNLFPKTLPPFSFITVPVTSSLSPLEMRFFVPGVVIPLALLLLGFYLFERRDVV